MLLPSMQAVANSFWFMAFAVVGEIISLYGMIPNLKKVESFGAGPPLDARFGFSGQELQDFYDGLGSEGCLAYQNMLRWDFFPYIPAYTLLGGALLILAARRAEVSEKLAYIMPATTFFDIVESSIFMRGCHTFPSPMEPHLVLVASLASTMKWILFGCFGVLLTCLVLLGFTKPISSKKIV